jgi:hypothetical protein
VQGLHDTSVEDDQEAFPSHVKAIAAAAVGSKRLAAAVYGRVGARECLIFSSQLFLIPNDL